MLNINGKIKKYKNLNAEKIQVKVYMTAEILLLMNKQIQDNRIIWKQCGKRLTEKAHKIIVTDNTQ